MGAVKGCDLPEELQYSIDNNVWVRRGDDGNVTVGMTAYACALAGQVVSYTPKKAGKDVKKDKSCATVESGKWVGPAKTPISGEVVAVNDAVSASPGLINQDPYGEGWLVKIKPADWDGDAVDLKTGADALAAFQAKMDADGFKGCA
ncbi:glycine cleavage system protein GcvH [Ectothiorhodospira lacustris]|uniref:glycine cleavage system protein GcvH n=1 Tax=Ectothiorhodospira lacustris TaxID=2899127 RepID=UPI001EE7AF37|nr:glycine cleavage system protein GcvH [Ectothiorhodospira lacustris]MCG5499574.1 glycine cleavage system protein GcvH [Ectothiorhodospira lacustris]MCG5508732.1 glycine cleavage system protein GcvH [Ectothiorhodospira lacustris]MCG5520523.1 glycine cleavage system protein GcvH [Ectothiorhodospira lacustris]